MNSNESRRISATSLSPGIPLMDASFAFANAVALYIDDNSGCSSRGNTPSPRFSKKSDTIPVIYLDSYDDILTVTSSGQSVNHGLILSPSIEIYELGPTVSSKKRGSKHIRRHSERPARVRKHSAPLMRSNSAQVQRKKSDSGLSKSRRSSTQSRQKFSDELMKPVTPEAHRKESRRRRAVLIVMIVFLVLVAASVLAVVVTLTHTTADNSTLTYYTFAKPSVQARSMGLFIRIYTKRSLTPQNFLIDNILTNYNYILTYVKII